MITKQLQKGKEVILDGKFEDLLEIVEGPQGAEVKVNPDLLQRAINQKGLYSIVCSEPLPPFEIHKLYQARSAAELQFRTAKTQLGYGAVRVQSTPSVKAKFLVGFVAAVIRHELEKASVPTGKSTDQMVHEADKLEMQKRNETYTYTHTESDRLKGFIERLGVDNVIELIDESVELENDRLAGRTITPRKRKTGMAKGDHRKKRDENGNIIHAKPGPKPGTVRSDINKDGTPRKKPGPKVGSKKGLYNKDGSLRKKPGPKPKQA